MQWGLGFFQLLLLRITADELYSQQTLLPTNDLPFNVSSSIFKNSPHWPVSLAQTCDCR